MTAKKPQPEPKIQNPRYEGATPETVALALLRTKPDDQRPGGKTPDDETLARGS